MTSFKLFAKSIRNTQRNVANNLISNHINLVIGNEAADLDSIVSAIALSYYLFLFPVKSHSCAPDTMFLPVFNINKTALRLRQDCQYVLNNYLSTQDENTHQKQPLGFFLDQLADVFLLLKNESSGDSILNKNVYLVDHNILKPDLAYLSVYLRGIVDHHVNEHKYNALNFENINPVGSCTSLIAQMLKSRFEELELSDYSQVMPLNFVLALLAPILIDTNNMKESSGRVSPVDKSSLDWLMGIIALQNRDNSTFLESKTNSLANGFGLESFETKPYFKLLSKLKKDTSNLSISELLDKDYKEINPADANLNNVRIGVASVSSRLVVLLEKYDINAIYKGFTDTLAAKSLDILILMTHGSLKNHQGDSDYGRELTLYFSPKFFGSSIDKFLKNLQAVPDLDLSPFSLPAGVVPLRNFVFYTQNNSSSSRKQVIPILNNTTSLIDTAKSAL
ncbi:hypothetical protein BB561_005979 [Smittium simulii]|uniref:DHHA2 domain-containing protein n=1 Tax=Smittium simulii TaxID=133385 RepID=A0A2T9Y785_9FUNG|nr:hypothetical protein BB561_005979 [Smittium simulii]